MLPYFSTRNLAACGIRTVFGVLLLPCDCCLASGERYQGWLIRRTSKPRRLVSAPGQPDVVGPAYPSCHAAAIQPSAGIIIMRRTRMVVMSTRMPTMTKTAPSTSPRPPDGAGPSGPLKPRASSLLLLGQEAQRPSGARREGGRGSGQVVAAKEQAKARD